MSLTDQWSPGHTEPSRRGATSVRDKDDRNTFLTGYLGQGIDRDARSRDMFERVIGHNEIEGIVLEFT
jgi:hypothetical protein